MKLPCVYLLKLLAVSLLILEATHAQTQFLFEWPGSLEVPINSTAIAPPDSARIQLAPVDGTERVISIREDVKATLDCSLILDAFTNANGVTAAEVTLQWLSRKIVSKGEFEGSEKIVSESVDRFSFEGGSNEILNIEKTGLPQTAREGNAGNYRCLVCLTSDNTVCQNGSVSVSVIAYIPVLSSSPTSYDVDAYYVGKDFCVLPGQPSEFVLGCTHNTSHLVTTSFLTATWTLNGAAVSASYSFGITNNNNIVNELIIELSRLTNDGLFESFLGEYKCVLENFGGNDTAMSIVTKCCEDSDIPIIGNSSGFVSVPTNDMLVIGESTCAQVGDGGLSIECPLSSGSNKSYAGFKYSWKKDGQILEDETSSTIATTEHGEYSCTASNQCGEDMGISQLYALPRIISFTGTITGITGNGCNRTGSPTTVSDLCPKPNEQFTLSCNSSISYTITGPNGVVSNGSLLIASASSNDDGVYTCSSDNLCNQVSSSMTVTLGQEFGRWSTSNWTECSEECGNGTRTRSVTCTGTVTGEQIPDELCEEDKPSLSETCVGTMCVVETLTWNYGEWSECSKSCGMGNRTRTVVCQSSTQGVVNDNQCTGLRPKVMSYCNISPCCERDLFPSQCNFIADSVMCDDPMYQEICCCTCRQTDFRTAGY